MGLSTLYSLPSTFYSLLSTLYSLLSTLCSLLSTLYSLLSTLYSLLSTLYSLSLYLSLSLSLSFFFFSPSALYIPIDRTQRRLSLLCCHMFVCLSRVKNILLFQLSFRKSVSH